MIQTMEKVTWTSNIVSKYKLCKGYILYRRGLREDCPDAGRLPQVSR